jgi:hypothetical protein
MAKRFTDTAKWKKPFIKKLNLEYKVFWFYLLDDCDHAGVWQVDLEVASIRIGFKLKLKDCINAFGDKIYQFDNNEKWFIKDFIDFQYGELNEKNRAHNSVIGILKKYNLLKLNKHLISPLQGGKDKDKDMDMDMDKDITVLKPLKNDLSLKVSAVINLFDQTNIENAERTLQTTREKIRERLIEFLEIEQVTEQFENRPKGEVLKHFRNWMNYNPPVKSKRKVTDSVPWLTKDITGLVKPDDTLKQKRQDRWDDFEKRRETDPNAVY